jgi:hypothetical protein
MYILERLGVRDWPEVHALMVERGFPHVPEDYVAAAQRMADVTLLGVRHGRRLGVVFVVGEDDEGISFLDVVCAADREGKWASRGLMAELADEVFGRMGLRCLWVQVHGRAALKAALQAGFTPATALDAKAPVLVMTRESAKSLFNKGRKGDGFVIQQQDAGAAGATAAKHHKG